MKGNGHADRQTDMKGNGQADRQTDSYSQLVNSLRLQRWQEWCCDWLCTLM